MGDLERAVEAHRAGDLTTAERLYRAVAAQQDSHDACGNLGVVLAARGAFAEAEAAYLRAIALRPTPTAHRRNLAQPNNPTPRLAAGAVAGIRKNHRAASGALARG